MSQHQNVIPPAEFATIQANIAKLVGLLDDAHHQSQDPTPTQQPLVVSQRTRTGHRGRPRVDIDLGFLNQALQLRGPSHIAPVLQCSARTIRRRALEAGLVEPGQPVFTPVAQPDGTVTQVHTSNSSSIVTSDVSDHQLDRFVADILQVFPNFGCSLIFGRLKAAGYHIPTDRIAASYVRVNGVPRSFGGRAVHRRTYNVAGANSLWHHDGQHGMLLLRSHGLLLCSMLSLPRLNSIQDSHPCLRGWQITLRCWYSSQQQQPRPDCARSLPLSHSYSWCTTQPCPWRPRHRDFACSRVDGGEPWSGPGLVYMGTVDTLSLAVCRFTCSKFNSRSVHNTRIERLWYDVTRGFGQKWKNFFTDLEYNCGLNPHIPAHIWLLHHLFLPAINVDAQDWASAWNSHKLQIRGERNRSPQDIFLFSMVQDGPRGLVLSDAPAEENVDPADLNSYGIDWDDADNPQLMEHLLLNNPQERDDQNPFHVGPTTLSDVPCEPPDCPFPADQIRRLDTLLAQRVDVTSRNMALRRIVWETALELCIELYAQ